jgi:hypothetical protein
VLLQAFAVRNRTEVVHAVRDLGLRLDGDSTAVE